MNLSQEQVERVRQIADDALNAAIGDVREAMGIQSGDTAEVFFSGPSKSMALHILTNYIHTELRRLPAVNIHRALDT